MLFAFLFSLVQAKRRVCVCNNECSLLCPSNSYVATSSNLQFKDYFISIIKGESEVEIDFYSKEEGFFFEIDSTYFSNTKVTLKTLSDSKTVKVNIKENFNPFDKSIEIHPNFQVTYPELEPIQQSINNDSRKSVLEEPDATPVPISVPIDWMTYTADGVGCYTSQACGNEIDYTGQCGKRCWTGGNNLQTFEYTFKGERFAVYGSKDPNHGNFDLYLNGNLIETIDEFNNNREMYTQLYLSDVLEYNQYTIKAAGKGDVFELYKFVFWPSVKAKRINSTQMSSTQTWNKETDGIGGVGEWTNNVGATKSIAIQGTKVWVYGTEAWNFGVMSIQFHNQKVDINTTNENRVDGKLLWESEEERFDTYEITITAQKYIHVLCIYYLNEPPIQTQTPNPSMTPIPGSSDIFINKVYSGDELSIQYIITSDSPYKQISGCTFNDITLYSAKIYFLKIETEIPFFDNTFQYTNLGDNRPMPIWMNFNGKFTIENCKFINCMHRSDIAPLNDGNVFNSNTNTKVNVTFYSCEFINCGNIEDRPIFGIYNAESTIYLTQCYFTFNTSVSSQILSSRTQDVSIDKCHFTNTGEIRIVNNGQHGSFKFTDNIVEFNHQSIIYAIDMKSTPTINGNRFESSDLDEATYLITYRHSVNEIELINNTFFQNRVSSGKQYGGSTAQWFQNDLGAKTTLIYTNCNFINNENAHTEEVVNNGGAIQYGYSTSIANTSITFRSCIFRGNRCTGKGGALSISIYQDLTILNCVFEANTAKQGATIYISGQLFKGDANEPDIENQEMDSLSIVNCQLIENQGEGDASGILIEEGIIKVNTINISSCTFSDNGNNNEQTLIKATCTKAIFKNNDVSYSDVTKASGVLRLNFTEMFELSDSTFNSCKFSGDTIIQLQSPQTNTPISSITNCIFNDCISSRYIISVQNGDSEINDCSFKFSTSDNACSSLRIDSPNVVFINNCKFEKNNNKVSEEASLYIHRETEEINSINIQNIIFDSCVGQTYSTIFVKGSISNFENIHNLTIQNSQNNQDNTYIYGFNVNKNISFEGCTFSNCRSNNQHGGGSGSKLIPLSKISFDRCTWKNNYCTHNGGAFQYGNDHTINNVEIEFHKCNFTKNRTPEFGGALSLQTHNHIFIEGCQFKENIAGATATSSNLLANKEGYGGAVYISPQIPAALSFAPVYSFTDTSFIQNQANDAHAIYIIDSQHMTVSIEDQNLFTDNGNTGSAIISDQHLNLEDSVFTTTDPGSEQPNPIQYVRITAIYNNIAFHQQTTVDQEQKEAYFYNCTFKDCGFDKSQGAPHQYIINIHCSKLTFDTCIIEFGNSDQACGGISIDCYCNMTIINSYFSRCNVKDLIQSAGIYYGPSTGIAQDEYLILNGNTFNEMEGRNSRCFKITVNYTKADLSDNTIQYSPLNGHTGALYLYGTDNYKFSGWKFLRNKANALLSGGCGLWIAPSTKTTNPPLFSFEDCSWEDNEAVHDPNAITDNGSGQPRPYLYNGLGGGFQFGFSESNAYLNLNFVYCKFVGNSAAFEGGALAIQTTQNCIIQNCIFEGNTAGTKSTTRNGDKTNDGGAIFIDPDFKNDLVQGERKPQISISSCTFTGNKAQGSGSALSLRGQNANFNIGNNTFSNNGESTSVFYSTALQLTFKDSIFTSPQVTNTRAIELAAEAIFILETITIEQFSLGGVRLSPQASSTHLLADQKYEFNNCTFKKCGSSDIKGGAIYADNVITIIIGRSTFDGCKGNGAVAYIGTNVNTFEFSYNTLRNMNDQSNFMIVSGASIFTWDGQGIDKTNNNIIKGIHFIGGTNIEIENMLFEIFTECILIDSNVTNALIKNCTFSDCPAGSEFIITVKNSKCEIINNSIVFAEELTVKGRAIQILSNGDIEVSHNRFINCFSSNHNQPTILFDPPQLQETSDTVVRFNYNFIQGVGNYKYSLFDINCQNQNFNLDHNIIFKCINTQTGPTENGKRGDEGYMCQITNVKSNELMIENLTVEQCECGSSYGGSLGIWISAPNQNEYDNKKLSFIDCKFINNKQTYHLGDTDGKGGGGGFQMNSPGKNAKFETLFERCTFSGNSAATNGGALSISTNKPTTIRDCIFTNNKALGQADGSFLTGCGGAIYLKTNNIQSCIIEGCTFENNWDKNGDGSAIYILNDGNTESSNSVEILPTCVFKNNFNTDSIRNYAIYTSSPLFSISESIISSTSVSNQVSGINFVGSNSENRVYNVTFEKCNNFQDSSARALAVDIHYETKQVTIDFCRFDFCGRREGDSTDFSIYTIYDQGKDTTIHNCTFTGGKTGQIVINGPAIKIKSYGNHVITNCNIIRPKCAGNGAISYLSENDGDNNFVGEEENGHFVLQHILIEDAQGLDSIALDFIVKKDDAVDMSDITIENCRRSKSSLIGLVIYGQASGFNFDKFTFKDNLVHISYGGGTGIWIERRDMQKTFNFDFTECSFIRNHAERSGEPNHHGYGGALQLGFTPESENFFFTVRNCTFEGNIADRYGGGLTIEAENSFTCENCQFIGNQAAERGGAIYVDPSVSRGISEITITGCTFEDNNSTGSAIYCKENGGSNSRMSITGKCQFRRSTKSNSTFVLARCMSLTISDVTFDNENLDKSCRAIKIENPATGPTIENSEFRNCAIEGGEGNAIYIESLPQGSGYQKLDTVIQNCLFENCGTTGWAIYSLERQLTYKNNHIKYTSNAKNQGGGGLNAVGGTIEMNTFENTFKYAGEKGNALNVIYSGENSYNFQFKFNHNAFIGCNGEDIRCFNIVLAKINDQCSEFENITVRNCPEAQALTCLFELTNPQTDYIELRKWNFINNSVLNIDGGSGLSIKAPNNFEVYFENNCLFENNTARNGKGGALKIGSNEDPAGFKLYIRGSTFRTNEASYGGALALETKVAWIIERQCIFENNKASTGGGAIYVNTNLADDHFTGTGSTIKSCTFNHNEVVENKQGTILYFTPTKEGGPSPAITIEGSNIMNNMGERGYLIQSGYANLVINDLAISGEAIENREFGFLYAFSSGTTTINSCRFTRVGSTSALGNAIRIDGETPQIVMNNCSFTDCVSNDNRNLNFVIYGGSGYNMRLTAENCVFNFTSTSIFSVAICIERFATFELYGCNFINCWSNNNNKNYPYPGAIRYGPNYDRTDYKDKFDRCRVTIRRCTFDNCNHLNGPASTGRVIHGYSGSKPFIENCTIKNTPNGGFILGWQYLKGNTASSTSITLENIIFENNQASCPDGGGSGIYIKDATKLEFRECHFIRNKQTDSESGGGGFSCGSPSSDLSNHEIEFIRCHFEDNSVPANMHGGSLYICSPKYQTTVLECTFTDTRNLGAEGVARLGGAIYITQNQGGVTIDGCTFTNTQSKTDGNAICINSDTSLVTIQNCIFTDCHHNQGFTVIWSFGQYLSYINNTIEFTNTIRTSRGLVASNPSQVEIRDSRFYNCVYNEHGCGFALNTGRQQDSKGIENIIIVNTIFDGCYSKASTRPRQSALYLCVNHEVTLDQVTIQNSNPTSNCNILMIETPNNKAFIEEQTIYRCSFINCSTQYEKDHKGGIGFKHDGIRNLIFNLCNFNNLRTAGFGGAIALNDPKNNADDCSIEFQSCNFGNNSVTGNNGKGASLYFNVSYSVTISNCNFTSQSLNGHGGAIYVQSSSNVLMENNGFYSTETSEGNGNAIYFAQGLRKATLINNNQFVDCGSLQLGSVIKSEADEFIFDGNTIQFTTPNQRSRGLEINSFDVIELTNSTFSKCHSDEFGGGLRINLNSIGTNSTINPFKDLIFDGCSANRGSAVYLNEQVAIEDLDFENCTFKKNKAIQHGGAIVLQIINYLMINECMFEENSANNRNIKSKEAELLFEKLEGRGGAIFISCSFVDSNESNQTNGVIIQNCTFKSNSAYDAYGIYIEGYERGESIIIKDNTFIDNCRTEGDHSNDIYFSYRSVISSEILNLFDEKVSTENSFIESDSEPLNKVVYVDHYGNPILPTNTPTNTPAMTQINTPANTPTGTPTMIQIDTPPSTPTDTPTTTPIIEIESSRTNMVTILSTLSITFLERRSISFSYSYFKSNTYSITYNEEYGTFIEVSYEQFYASYFPYIIHYFSPSYISTFLIINVKKGSSLTKEKLIGISCGSACVIFFALWIIITIVRRNNANAESFDEFGDLSSTSIEENLEVVNNNEPEIVQPQQTQDDSSSDLQFWLY